MARRGTMAAVLGAAAAAGGVAAIPLSASPVSAAPVALTASAPVSIGSTAHPDDAEVGIAVDATGNLDVAYYPSSGSLDFCKLALGATTCTPATLPTGSVSLNIGPGNQPQVIASGSDVYVFAPASNGEVMWTSTNGGTSFPSAPVYVSSFNGTAGGEDTNSPQATALASTTTANPGVLFSDPAESSASEDPAFQANGPLSGPANINAGQPNPPKATVNPSGYTLGTDHPAYQYTAATAAGSNPGVLSVITGEATGGPCSSTASGSYFTFAPVSASTTTTQLDTSPGTAGSPWSALTNFDCTYQAQAVAAGATSDGVLETGLTGSGTSLASTTVFRAFIPPSTVSAPVMVAPEAAQSASLSEDGSGGYYATWIGGATGASTTIRLGYSPTGATWSEPITLATATQAYGYYDQQSAVDAAGQGWTVYAESGSSSDPGTLYAQSFTKADAGAFPTTTTTPSTTTTTPSTTTTTPKPTPTPKVTPPSLTAGHLKGLTTGKALLTFVVKAGANAGALKGITVKLPGGLTFVKSAKKLKSALSVSTGDGRPIKTTDSLVKGVLHVTLKTPQAAGTETGVTITHGGLSVSGALKKKLKKHGVKSLTATIGAANATGTHKLTLKLSV